MTTFVFYSRQIKRIQKIVQSVTMSFAVGLMTLASVGFYLYAYTSLAQLEHVTPDELARAIAGPQH